MFKYIFYMIFLMPLIFIMNLNYYYWLIQFMLFFLSMIFIILNILSLNYFNLSMFFGCDLFSFGLILLSIWISSLMIIASQKIYQKLNSLKYFLFLIIFLLILLVLTFSSLNLLMFYFFFEISLIPILFMILGWGYQSNRIQAGLYMFFYTLIVSLPFLLGIFKIYSDYFNLFIPFFIFFSFKNLYFYFSMVMAFLVKMPIFLVHLWLPKAHVEAPVSGSMILAGIMLKLGGYGLIRIFNLLYYLNSKYNYFFIVISLLGGMIVSLMCLVQYDLKSLIAYSSIVHMSLVIGGMMTMNSWGLMGSYLMMISHGLCSSGLFCLSNIVYERLGSRSILINKGLINFLPSLSLWWFLLCTCNMASPPSLNLLSEIMLINSLIFWSNYLMILMMFLSFFSALYSLYLFSITQHGNFDKWLFCFSQGEVREYILLLLHWFPLNLMILVSNMFIMFI